MGEILRSLNSLLECRTLASNGDMHVDISMSNMLPHQPSAHLCAREHLSSVFSGHCFRLTLTPGKGSGDQGWPRTPGCLPTAGWGLPPAQEVLWREERHILRDHFLWMLPLPRALWTGTPPKGQGSGTITDLPEVSLLPGDGLAGGAGWTWRPRVNKAQRSFISRLPTVFALFLISLSIWKKKKKRREESSV